MENSISISKINDFIFCPVSIYFHNLDENTEKIMYQSDYQLNGTKAHESIDTNSYSDKKNILQGIDIYSEKYNLTGKIDLFDVDQQILTERKNLIKNIYDGYIFQLYAEYFCLIEMGYKVLKIRLYSMKDNKVFYIKKPEEDQVMYEKFLKTILDMERFSFNLFNATNIKKCENCIYSDLCSYSLIG